MAVSWCQGERSDVPGCLTNQVSCARRTWLDASAVEAMRAAGDVWQSCSNSGIWRRDQQSDRKAPLPSSSRRKNGLGWAMFFSMPWRASSTHSSRSEEHKSELQSLMRISYAVFCLKKTTKN